MAKINLLPWREQLKSERKKIFFATLAVTILLTLGLITVSDVYISSGISHQANRNQYIQGEINKLDDRISEIKDLRTKKEELLERMKIIQNLQGNRPVIVRIFDQVAQIVPDGVYFKELALSRNNLTLVGVAESNNRISDLMRNFDSSKWFSDPNLTAVRKVSENSERWNEFDLTVKQINPSQDEGGA